MQALSRTSIRLDVHVHQIPLRQGDIEGLPGIAWTAADRLSVDGTELLSAELYRPQALIEWMDKQGIERAWISIPPSLYRPQLDADEAFAWSQAVNQALCAVAGRHPKRLSALLHLPVRHAPAAAAVAAAAVLDGHHRFAMAAGDAAAGTLLSDPAYAPLWRALDGARAFLLLHPIRGPDPRYDRFHLQNLLYGPCELALAAAHLAMSGTLEKHPRITVCLAQGGGATAAAAGRLQRGQETRRPGAWQGGEPVRVSLRRLYVDCITHDASALELAAAVHGSEHVLFGSGWPFAMGLPEPRQQLKNVPVRLRASIFTNLPPGEAR